MKRFQLVIFDLDGTILDTLADIYTALDTTLLHFNLPRRGLSEVRGFLGCGARHLIAKSVAPLQDPERIAAILAWYSAYYEAHCAVKTRPYPGILELMAALKAQGVRAAVVSNKQDAAVQKLCGRYFPSLFSIARGERAGIKRKPAADMVNAVLAQLAVRRTAACYVGDSEVDIATAQNAALPCLAVSWGFRAARELEAAGAEEIFRDAAALRRRLLP